MAGIRVLGLVFAVVLVFLAFRARRDQRLSRLNYLIAFLVAGVLGVVSIYPDVTTPILNRFDFRQGANSGRLVGLLILSNLFLYLLFLRNAGVTDLVNRNLIRSVQAQAARRFDEEFPQAGEAPICVVIPAYNEADNLAAVLEEIPTEISGKRVWTLVSVDGATDDTEALAREHGVTVAVHAINLGGGAALSTGYQIAIKRGAEVIVTIDADGQNLPEEMPRLVLPILSGDADIVNGSRVLGRYERDSVIRGLGVRFFSTAASILSLRKITDLSSGYRAIRADKLADLELRQQQFHASEFMLDALRKGLVLKEVPITFKRRNTGDSKKPDPIRYGWGFAKAFLQTWLR